MARELMETIGISEKKNLLSDPIGAEKIVVPIEPGSGTIKRGTIVYRKDTGMWAPAADSNIVVTGMFAVLDETVISEAATDEVSKVAEDAIAYRSGNFINGVVTLASDATVTEANKAVLIRQGIKFDHKTETASFDNSVE